MKKVIVLVGGFAGSVIARALENSFDVTLIDSKDYFEFTPSILRTIVEPEHIKKIQVLHRHYLKKARIIRGFVDEINKTYVWVNGKKLFYDYLAICSGSRYSFPIKEQNIVYATRANHLRDYHKKLDFAKNVVIVGGGLVGVELAAEICTNYTNKKITLVHSGARLMERNSLKASDYAENFLKNRGVEILFNERVIGFNKKIITNKKSRIKADIIFACTGIKPNSEFMAKYFLSYLEKKGHLKVNNYLQVGSFGNIFSAGDVNNVHEEKTAQNAINQAKVVINNIKSMGVKGDLREYKSYNHPLSVSLGKWNGMFIWNYLVFKGFIPGIMKTLIEKWEMRNWRK